MIANEVQILSINNMSDTKGETTVLSPNIAKHQSQEVIKDSKSGQEKSNVSPINTNTIMHEDRVQCHFQHQHSYQPLQILQLDNCQSHLHYHPHIYHSNYQQQQQQKHYQDSDYQYQKSYNEHHYYHQPHHYDMNQGYLQQKINGKGKYFQSSNVAKNQLVEEQATAVTLPIRSIPQSQSKYHYTNSKMKKTYYQSKTNSNHNTNGEAYNPAVETDRTQESQSPTLMKDRQKYKKNLVGGGGPHINGYIFRPRNSYSKKAAINKNNKYKLNDSHQHNWSNEKNICSDVSINSNALHIGQLLKISNNR